jgi:hypothetical protein
MRFARQIDVNKFYTALLAAFGHEILKIDHFENCFTAKLFIHDKFYYVYVAQDLSYPTLYSSYIFPQKYILGAEVVIYNEEIKEFEVYSPGTVLLSDEVKNDGQMFIIPY